jgi:hypothetical protein
MIGCLLMVMVRDDCLFVINKQPIISHHYHQQTIISHHYHQQTNNHLSPLPSTNNHLSPLSSTNKQSSEMIVCLLMLMVRDECLFVDGNGER